MSTTLSDLLAEHTALGHDDADHLQRLVGEWQLLADLSFADLLLWAETKDGKLICAAQVRPTTAPTAHHDDQVGEYADAPSILSLEQAIAEKRIVQGSDPERRDDVPVSRDVIPVLLNGRVVGVLSRDTGLAAARSPSPLERAYLASAGELLQMVATGSFPVAGQERDLLTGPRAGDGLLRLDARGHVVYASPNALSAYRRMGVTADLVDVELPSLTRTLVNDSFDGSELATRMHRALAGASPLRIEVEARNATMLFRALPLRQPGADPGVLVLIRDVTDVRRRDRQLLSKDATIREIHHRVKNNLQTVAALLRLQARRVTVPAARNALQESVRRVSSIALVHETLSQSLDERVEFDGIVDRLIPMVTEVTASEAVVRIRRNGSFGVLPAELATPLVMVLTELLQNAAEHAYSDKSAGEVLVTPERTVLQLKVTVADGGAGLPPGFSLEASERLGLQIVRTLVESELRGTISVRNRPEGGTAAVLRVPLSRRG